VPFPWSWVQPFVEHIQEVIYLETSSEWFNSLFLRSLKKTKKSGDLVEQNLRFKLSPQLAKKIAEAAELRNSSKGKSNSGGTKEDKRKRKTVIPANKTTRAKAKIEPRQTKIRKQQTAEPMELWHKIPESFSGEEINITGSHKSKGRCHNRVFSQTKGREGCHENWEGVYLGKSLPLRKKWFKWDFEEWSGLIYESIFKNLATNA